MPHVSDGGADLSSEDEIKVFQVEGEGEEKERTSSENLKEVKSSLVAEVPEDEEDKDVRIPSQSFIPAKSSHIARADVSPLTGKPFITHPYGYVVSPFHTHPNGALGTFPLHVSEYVPRVSIVTEDGEFYRRWPFVGRVPMVPPNHVSSPFPLMMYPPHEGVQPPPAHMGIPPLHIDSKTVFPVSGEMRASDSVSERWRKDLGGFPRPPLYSPFPPTSQYFCPDFSQSLQWHPHSSMYHTFRPPAYPGSVPITSSMNTKLAEPISPYIISNVSHHPLLGRKLEMSEAQDNLHLCNFSPRHLQSMNHFSHHQSSSNHSVSNSTSNSTSRHPNPSENASNGGENSPSRSRSEKKKTHIKKPLNAFMMFMKEMRPAVQAECTLKESAAINQILGRRWHNLSREEQSKYYDMAKEARQLHQQLYPNWTARDNYAINAKKKKKKRDKSQDGDGNNPKKCRARFGLDQQSSWCKPCRRKKKCIRYLSGSEHAGDGEENIGSVESVGTPDSRFDTNASHMSSEDEDDSGNVESNSSEYSLSSPSVPRPLDSSVQSVLENGKHHLTVGSPPSQQIHHPLNVQHLSQSSGHHHHHQQRAADSPEGGGIPPQLPTPPPSTDSVGVAVT